MSLSVTGYNVKYYRVIGEGITNMSLSVTGYNVKYYRVIGGI